MATPLQSEALCPTAPRCSTLPASIIAAVKRNQQQQQQQPPQQQKVWKQQRLNCAPLRVIHKLECSVCKIEHEYASTSRATALEEHNEHEALCAAEQHSMLDVVIAAEPKPSPLDALFARPRYEFTADVLDNYEGAVHQAIARETEAKEKFGLHVAQALSLGWR